MERQNARQHLVQDYTHGPPICCHVIAFTFEDFRSEVCWSTGNFKRCLIMAEDLSNTEVNYLQVAEFIKQYILQLKISVHYVTIMEVLQPKDQLHTVELNLSFGEFFGLLEYFCQLAASYKRHHEVKSYFCREEVENFGEKLIFGIDKNLHLSEGRSDGPFVH